MIEPVYIGYLTFSLQPIYDELITYDPSRETFKTHFGGEYDAEIDFDAAWKNADFQRDLAMVRCSV